MSNAVPPDPARQSPDPTGTAAAAVTSMPAAPIMPALPTSTPTPGYLLAKITFGIAVFAAAGLLIVLLAVAYTWTGNSLGGNMEGVLFFTFLGSLGLALVNMPLSGITLLIQWRAHRDARRLAGWAFVITCLILIGHLAIAAIAVAGMSVGMGVR